MLLQNLLASFADELEKIAAAKTAMVGAAIGGLVGSQIPGGTKAKAIGAGLGALVGHTTGAVAKGAKRALWDEQQAREHHALYSHIPSYGAEQSPGTFY